MLCAAGSPAAKCAGSIDWINTMFRRFVTKYCRSLFYAALLAVPATGYALAAEKADVKANSGLTEIYSFGRTYSGTCNSAPPPTFKIKKQPEHGKIVAKVVRKRFAKDHKRCAGKAIKVFIVAYKPNRGYRGKDTASVSLKYDIYANVAYNTNRTLKFDISVK
jgi:hypothetical protein